MPRRQLLRTIGAALAVGALEALRPRAVYAAGSAQVCGPDNGVRKACCVQIKMGYHHGGYYTPAEECCTGPNGETGRAANLMSWVCPKGMCGEAGQCKIVCAADRQTCGSQCCPRGWFCGDAKRSRCCQNGEDICLAPAPSRIATCCKPGTKCCFNAIDARCCDAGTKCCSSAAGISCCAASQTCIDGTCRCETGQSTCGSECCAANESCIQQKCCRSPKVNCNGTCCDEDACCQLTASLKVCCNKGYRCASIYGSGISGKPKTMTCCETAQVAVSTAKWGGPQCCPAGMIPTPTNIPEAWVCCPPKNPNCWKFRGGASF